MVSAPERAGRGVAAAVAARLVLAGPVVVVVVAWALTAATVFAGTGLHPVPWLTWVAPLPMLVAAPFLSRRVGAATSFVAWATGMTNLWTFATVDLGLPALLASGFIAVQAAAFALVVTWFGALVRGGRPGAALVGPTSAAVAVDYLQSLVSPHGTYLSLSVTQADQAFAAPIASVSGRWGITALLVAVPAAAALVAVGVVRGISGAAQARRLAVLAATVVIPVLASTPVGAAPVGAARGPTTLRAAAVSDPSTADYPPEAATADGDRVLADLIAGVTWARSAGADVVVLPEATLITTAAERSVVLEALRGAAGPDLSVVVGLVDRAAGGVFHNEAVLLPPGRAEVVYRKRHPVPGVETGVEPGRSGVSVVMAGRRWALAVCKDLDFPPLVRGYARQGVDVLLVPGSDFGSDDWYHSRVALLAAAETGLPLVRTARAGRLTVSDAQGRLLGEARSSSGHQVALVADVPVDRSGRTVYVRFGDWFAWLALALVAGIVLRGRRPRGRLRGGDLAPRVTW